MEIQELRVYSKVVQLGSFTKAAEALKTHKAVISRTLSQLEKKLGVRLLERNTRSLRPTEIGQLIYERALNILDSIEATEQLAQQVWQAPKGTLRLTCGVEFGMLIVQDWINRYLHRYPKIVVEADFTNRLVDVVHEHFDLAIRVGFITEPHFIVRKLGQIDYGLFASPTYLRQHSVPQHPQALTKHALLEFAAEQTTSYWLLQQHEQSIQVPLQSRLRINNHFALRDAALADLGIVRLPHILADPLVKMGQLQALLTEWNMPSTPIHAIFPSNRFLTPKVTAFLACYPDYPPEKTTE